MPSSLMVRVVFGLLFVATIGAFFITQRLKGQEPVVLRFAREPVRFSPNGDRTGDATRVGFDLSEPAEVSFSIVDDKGDEVRRVVDDRKLAGDAHHRFRWDGRDNAGRVVPDGSYGMQVVLRDEGRTLDSFKEVVVDTKPPKVRIASVSPNVISPNRLQLDAVRLRYDGPPNFAPEFRVWRTDGGPTRVVQRFRGCSVPTHPPREPCRTGTWDGRVRGKPAVDGNYAFSVRIRDKAGNEALAPSHEETLPAAAARPRTGVAVRRVTARGPLDLVAAGEVASFEIGPRATRFEFALRRLGTTRPVRRGRHTGRRFRVRIPARARTGLYLMRIKADDLTATVPVTVSGTPPARGDARVLVVLPAITWQGSNPFDDDLDGFGDTLENAPSVPLRRPFLRGGLPAGFRSETTPLLHFLNAEKLPYELTTDIDLARKEGPRLEEASGVVFAGSARWLTEELDQRLRRYVEAGGRLASFGSDAFRRSTRLTETGLDDAGSPEARNVFGEAVRMQPTEEAPMSVISDELGLFSGTDGLAGLFTRFEESRRLVPGAEVLTSAGREPERPAFVAYRLGEGLVIRVGAPAWADELEGNDADDEVARVTLRIWTALSE